MKGFFSLLLDKFIVSLKERALILVMEVIQDVVADVRRNGLDNRKKQNFVDRSDLESENFKEMSNRFKQSL